MTEHAGLREGSTGQDDRPELADIARMARRLMRLAVSAARADDAPLQRVLREHLGPDAPALPVVSGSWRGYDHVNLQAGLDAWLGGPIREHELIGLTGLRNTGVGLADLLQPGADAAGVGVGSVAMAARPAGPAGLTRACVKCGLYLVNDGGERMAVLLHGAPGTGKTHTIRYLLGRLPAMTVVVLSGYGLRWIAEACSVARVLQPSVVVIEDVDLIAEDRGLRTGQHPLLFQLLNEMDGLGEDIDVTFLLTTNRPDLLEAALAARPGRIDHAAELPVPDADARRKLIALYQGGLKLDLADPDDVIKRTEGVTAAFIKELLRRAALLAAEDAPSDDPDGPDASAGPAPLCVTDAQLSTALNQLLDVRSGLTRTLLGGRGQDAVIRPMGADALLQRVRRR